MLLTYPFVQLSQYPNAGGGLNGGCGGGGGDFQGGTDGGAGGSATQISGPNYIGYGYPGGVSSATRWGGAGGGGAGGAGSPGIAVTVVPGGSGFTSSISGAAQVYSGGGFGNADAGVLRPTGQDMNGNTVGEYGWGANGTGYPNLSPYNGAPGIVIVRYTYNSY